MVDTAAREYEFWRRRRDRVLVRRSRRSPAAGFERLVDGCWIDVRRPRKLDSGTVWEPLRASKSLRWHARRYLIVDLGAPGICWQGRHFWRRLKRSAVARWLFPPLKGGAKRRGITDVAKRQARDERYRLLAAGALAEFEAQALLGYEHQRERVRGVEQRANFFLGAAGLTTSLVLANAGLLLDSDQLDPPWLYLAAITLGLATLFTIVAGLRALQATMTTFTRLPPDNVPRLDERLSRSEGGLRRARVAALLVAQYRTSAIADWKLGRLKAARTWFVAAVAWIVVLTVFVLVNVAEDDRPPPKNSAPGLTGPLR